MTLTVNITSFRYGHLISHCIESVLSQTKKPDVIRVYDDGVGDCTHIKQLYPEIEFIERKKNLGIVKNFNQALNRTDTDRVLFLGADNYLHPRALELMSGKKEDIVSCDAYIIGEGKYRKWKLPYQPHGSAMYNVEKAKDVGGYEPSGREKTEEDSMLFKKMLDAGATFHRVDRPLLYYRTHRRNFNQ